MNQKKRTNNVELKENLPFITKLQNEPLVGSTSNKKNVVNSF